MSAHTVDYIIKWMFSIYSALYTVNIYENHSFSHLYAEFFLLVLTEVLLYVILLDKVFSQQVSDQSAYQTMQQLCPLLSGVSLIVSHIPQCDLIGK